MSSIQIGASLGVGHPIRIIRYLLLFVSNNAPFNQPSLQNNWANIAQGGGGGQR